MKKSIFSFLLLMCFASTAIYAQSSKRYKSIVEATKNASTVQHLDLSGQSLTQVPAEVFTLTNLRSLNLSKNKLMSLPADIAKLQNLKALTINENQLTALPKEITQISGLMVLFAKSNQISDLPKGMGQLGNLKLLNLDDNKLTKFPEALLEYNGQNCKLHRYSDRNNPYSSEGKEAVPAAFAQVLAKNFQKVKVIKK